MVYDVIVGAVVTSSLALFSITMHGGQLCPDRMPLTFFFYRLTALLQCASEDRGGGGGATFPVYIIIHLCFHPSLSPFGISGQCRMTLAMCPTMMHKVYATLVNIRHETIVEIKYSHMVQRACLGKGYVPSYSTSRISSSWTFILAHAKMEIMLIRPA